MMCVVLGLEVEGSVFLVQYSTYYLTCAFSMQMVEVFANNPSFIVFNGLVH